MTKFALSLLSYARCAKQRATTTVVGVCMMLCIAPSAIAQQLFVRNYFETDGLPSSTVADAAQDDLGRMWFSTRSGVAVYDGLHWETFDLNSGLPALDIAWIVQGPSKRMFAFERGGSAAVFEDGAWHVIDNSGTLAGTDLSAVAIANNDGSDIILAGMDSGGFYYFDDDTWRPVDGDMAASDEVNDIIINDERALVATSSGLFQVSFSQGQPQTSRVDAVGQRLVYAVSAGPTDKVLWILGKDYIAQLRHGDFEIIEDGFDLEVPTGPYYVRAQADMTGGLYFGNPYYLYRFDPQTGIERFNDRNGFPSGGPTSLLLDYEGCMWMTSLRGVSKVAGLQFVSYNSDDGFPEDEVTAILERVDGEMVLGHSAGITFLNSGDRIEFPTRFHTRVLDLDQDSHGNVYAAVFDYGLGKIAPGGDIEWIPVADDADKLITSLRVADDDVMWVTSSRSVYNNIEGDFELAWPDLRDDPDNPYLRRLFIGPDDTVYLASNIGLFVVSGERRHYSTGEFHSMSIYSVSHHPSGTLFLGTLGGLYVLEDEEMVKAEAPLPVIDKPVYFIVNDHDGDTWFGTDNGVYRWDGTSLLRHYTLEDGLIGRETNRAAGLVDSRGQLWIGMERGVTIYRPQYDAGYAAAPRVYLGSIDVGGVPQSPRQRIELPYEHNSMTFRFHVPSFVNEDHVRVQSRLVGFDNDWSESSIAASRDIRYTNLSPGTYRFEVRAASRMGVWSEPVSSQPVVIAAPFWRRTPFIVFGIVLAALVIFAIVALIDQRRYARRLEREVSMRLRELRAIQQELAKTQRLDSLGVLAGGIAHDFNNILTVMMGNLSLLQLNPSLSDAARHNIGDTLSATTRAKSLTQQLLTFSQGGEPVKRSQSMADLVAETSSFVTSGKNVSCRSELPADMWPVYIDADQMSHVINNVLLNAEHAMPDGGVVTVEGHHHDTAPRTSLAPGRYVETVFIDEGVGIPEENINRVFDPYFSTKAAGSGLGLATAYSIVDRHGGLIEMESTIDVGTRCHIFLPVAEADDRDGEAALPPQPALQGRILVMDDERLVRNVVGRTLVAEGHEVAFAKTGTEAIDIYQDGLHSERPFDLVLMDLTIPGDIGGLEALAALRKIDPDVCAVVASGYSQDPVLANFADYGFRERIVKPFSTSELRTIVRKVLAARMDPSG